MKARLMLLAGFAALIGGALLRESVYSQGPAGRPDFAARSAQAEQTGLSEP